MSSSLLALLGYAGWTLALVAGVAALRVTYTLTGRRAANRFAPSGDDVSPFSGRLCRAHANAYENLPIFAAVIVTALLSGNESITDPLAMYVLAARIGQSAVHLVSTSRSAVTLRFVFFVPQLGVLASWVLRLASSG